MKHCPNCGSSSLKERGRLRIFNRFTPVKPRRTDVLECESCKHVFERINCMDHPESERWRFLPYSVQEYKKAEANEPESNRVLSEIVFGSYSDLARLL